jgi:hypothetical protein
VAVFIMRRNDFGLRLYVHEVISQDPAGVRINVPTGVVEPSDLDVNGAAIRIADEIAGVRIEAELCFVSQSAQRMATGSTSPAMFTPRSRTAPTAETLSST